MIYNQEKVISAQLQQSDQVGALLSKINKKEGLSTAVLLLNGEECLLLLFILENKRYATYRLIDNCFTPLPFSDYMKALAHTKGTLDLYLVSPVLFKILLMLAQMEPKVVVTSEIMDPEQLLTHIEAGKKEAVMVLKNRKRVNLFYFLEGELRDAYLEGTSGPIKTSDLQEKLYDQAFSQSNPVRIELFDETGIKPATDADAETEKEEIFLNNTAFGQENNNEDEPFMMEDDKQGETPEEITGNDFSKYSSSREAKKKPDPPVQVPGDYPAQETPSDICVEVLNGNRAGFLIRAASEPISLGRGKVIVRLKDPQISRFHAELEWTESGLVIRDQKSTNGLFINEEKVAEKALILDDIIRIGDVRLKVIRAS